MWTKSQNECKTPPLCKRVTKEVYPNLINALFILNNNIKTKYNKKKKINFIDQTFEQIRPLELAHK